MSKEHSQLPRVAFSILLALSLKQRHGYEIIKQVHEDSNGKINMGPGALYTSVKQLLARNLIEEVKQTEDPKRRYYKITDFGAKALNEELEYYENVIQLAKQRKALHHVKPSSQAV